MAFGRPLQTGSILNPDIYSLGIEFWNEHRSYIRNSEKWFWSRGLTANTGYTAYDYSSPGLLENSGNAFVIGAGYRLGIGYRFANRFNVITSINPRVNFQKNINFVWRCK